jgi:hypothetical protein
MAIENDDTTDETPAGGDETPAEPTTMLQAIGDALAPTIPAETPAGDETTDETPADEEVDPDELEADDQTAEDGTTVDKNGRRHGPDGKLLPNQSADTGKNPDGTPKDGTGKGAKADPVNDPIPEDIKGRTRERMTALIDTVKAKDEIIGNQGVVIDAVKQTGATPEEFANSIKYMGLCRSDKPEDLKAARDMIMGELESIALKLGEPTPGVDFLKNHADLQEMVNNGQITQDIAEETARLRTAHTRKAEQTQRQQETQQQTEQQATEARANATTSLNELGQTLSENDPLFEAKMKLMPDLKAMGARLPPAQWRGAFMAAYKAAGETLSKRQNGGAPVAKVAAKPGQPLRANKSPSGGQSAQPKSILEAVTAAVQSAG